MKQEIPKSEWSRSHSVKYYFMGNFQGTQTKNQALQKITESLRDGFHVHTGENCKQNYLKVSNDE
jgi:hypothetical protein